MCFGLLDSEQLHLSVILLVLAQEFGIFGDKQLHNVIIFCIQRLHTFISMVVSQFRIHWISKKTGFCVLFFCLFRFCLFLSLVISLEKHGVIWIMISILAFQYLYQNLVVHSCVHKMC